MEETESVDQSVESDSTPTIEESAPQAESDGAESQEAKSVEQEDKPVPFHEHPRWKEVIEERNSFKQGMSEYKQALDAMQRELQSLRQQSIPKKEEPKDPFLADLEKIKPEYAKSLQAVYDQAQKTVQLEQRLQQYEAQQFQEKAVNHFNNLLETNKIADPMDRKLYERAVRAEVYEREAKGEKLGLKDLDSIFKSFHGEYSKAMEERDRKLTASYVKEKTKDATPRGATGGVPSTSGVKKLAAGDIPGQAKWLANQIRNIKKEH